MANIAARENYRNVFLKSEHWASMRAEALVHFKSRCAFCATKDFSNDVHHVHYPDDLYRPHSTQLVVLCRSCHEFVHERMKLYGKPETPSECWKQYHRIRLEYLQEYGNPRQKNSKRLLEIILSTGIPMTIAQVRHIWACSDSVSKCAFATSLVHLLEYKLVFLSTTGFLIPRAKLDDPD